MGGTIGLSDPARLHAVDTHVSALVTFLSYWGTVALALLAVAILLAMVQRWGRLMPRRALRTLGWLGTLMVLPGAAGLVLIIAFVAGFHVRSDLGGVEAAAYAFVYSCFLILGLSFFATAWLTDPRRR